MADFKKTDIRFKLVILSLISLLGMIISLVVFVHTIAANLYEEKKAQTQRLIESATGVINYFHRLEESGDLSSSVAREMAMNSLNSALFGETGYFWMNDTEGVMLINPNTPDLVGTNVINTVDINGKYLFKDFINVASQGGGWVEYYWPRPGSPEAFRKLSYVKLFAPWDWIVGTGLYLDDMEKEVRAAAIQGVVFISVTFSLLIIISVMLSNKFMKQLKSIAIHDALTGLFTRRYLLEVMPIFIAKHDRNPGECLSVIFFDIDHFKSVNDTFGHSGGDQILAGVGKTINDVIRQDDLGIRYGGEEFVVVMLCDSNDDAIQVAERIRQQSNTMIIKGDEKFAITISAGIAFREKGERFDRVLKRADDNLYKAKKMGRDRVVF